VSPGTPAFAERLKAAAYGLGFDLCGVARLGPAETSAAFERWLGAGYAGEMDYLARGAEKRRDTRLPVPASRARTAERAPAASAVVVAMDYGGRAPDGAGGALRARGRLPRRAGAAARRAARVAGGGVRPAGGGQAVRRHGAGARARPFAPREALAGKDARTLARELFGMTQEEFRAAFRARR
jgi:hypothetical protein